jgi:predicted kinase
LTLIVVSGAPGTGKSTIARELGVALRLPVLSLDPIKEALADVLGLGDEDWSNRVGDAAAEVVFRLAAQFPDAVAEGWWRGPRRDRAVAEFAGAVEVFCRVDPDVAAARSAARRDSGRHGIHRDMINPAGVGSAAHIASLAATVTPLRLGGPLIEVDTGQPGAGAAAVSAVRSALGRLLVRLLAGFLARGPCRWQAVLVPTRLVHLVIDAVDPARLARFWAAALGWEAEADEDGVANLLPRGYQYPDPVALPLVFLPVPQAKTGKNRIHLDLASQSEADQAAQVERLLGLGAVRADIGQGDVPWQVLADPEGNEFCVLDPRPVYLGIGPVAAVVADCRDPAAVAGFWRLATGWVPGDSIAFLSAGSVSLRSPAGVGPYLELLPSADTETVKNRIHLDVAPEPGEDQAAAAAALRAAGAVPVDIGQGSVSWIVLADPEGSEFCLLSPR